MIIKAETDEEWNSNTMTIMWQDEPETIDHRCGILITIGDETALLTREEFQRVVSAAGFLGE